MNDMTDRVKEQLACMVHEKWTGAPARHLPERVSVRPWRDYDSETGQQIAIDHYGHDRRAVADRAGLGWEIDR